MATVFVAVLAAVGFTGVSLLALFGRRGLTARGRSYSIAVAAGILLSLTFGDLFPDGLELAGRLAVFGFVGGFTLMFLTETFTRTHTHHSPNQRVGGHALGPFVLGLAIHNLADGFVLGVGAEASMVGLVGFGVLVHQAPVGISLAAVLTAEQAGRGRVLGTTVLLGLAIPIAAVLTLGVPVPGDRVLGTLTGVAGGVLCYMGAAHLLPEAQAEHPGRITGVLFSATLILTTVALFTVLGD